jgi:hypothetical protein
MQRKHWIAITVAMVTGFSAPSFAQAPAQPPATASVPTAAPRAGVRMDRRAYRQYGRARMRHYGQQPWAKSHRAAWHGHRHRHGYRHGHRHYNRMGHRPAASGQRHQQQNNMRRYKDRSMGPI